MKVRMKAFFQVWYDSTIHSSHIYSLHHSHRLITTELLAYSQKKIWKTSCMTIGTFLTKWGTCSSIHSSHWLQCLCSALEALQVDIPKKTHKDILTPQSLLPPSPIKQSSRKRDGVYPDLTLTFQIPQTGLWSEVVTSHTQTLNTGVNLEGPGERRRGNSQLSFVYDVMYSRIST